MNTRWSFHMRKMDCRENTGKLHRHIKKWILFCTALQRVHQQINRIISFIIQLWLARDADSDRDWCDIMLLWWNDEGCQYLYSSQDQVVDTQVNLVWWAKVGAVTAVEVNYLQAQTYRATLAKVPLLFLRIIPSTFIIKAEPYVGCQQQWRYNIMGASRK